MSLQFFIKLKLWSFATAFSIFLFSPNLTSATERQFVHVEKANISTNDRLENFAILYGLQWGSYILTQHKGIREDGSFNNWKTYPFNPHFDFDGINFNIFGHTYSGQLYYQYYRANGYGEGASFLWAIISSTSFEFTIETITERPSLQDLYQTPVFGTIVGAGFERASLFFHSLEVWPARVAGYIFNPFSLFPGSSYKFIAAPVLNPQAPGASVSWRF